MQWWNDFVDWLASDDGSRVLVSTVLPFLAIIVAGIVAAVIGRGSTKRLLTLNDRENRVSAVATMIGAARRASVWNTLSTPEQQHADHVAAEADVRIRLLAVPGSSLAADWAAHEIATMKTNSVSFSFQAEQTLLDFRDRMVTWQARPSRAKKLFKNDLDLWAYERSQAKSEVVTKQQAWAAAQVASETGPIATVTPAQSEVAAPRQSFEPAESNQASAPARTLSDQTAASSTAPTFRPPSLPPRPQAEATGTGETPALVEPDQRDGSNDASTGDANARLEDALYSSPVSANSVAGRTNPQRDDDDRN